ncbi:MAG: glycosyltransferase [Candidatus Cloacimonetes bacterium]|nr:glycosyltransferase [Candidatus Cloacimonadota bacterium]
MTVLLYFTIVYSLILLILFYGVNKSFHNKKINLKINKLSVVIAVKNEESHIYSLLELLNNQNYPKDSFEVIIADDGSSDKTAEIVKQFIIDKENFIYIYVSQADLPKIKGKKKALTSGINISQYPILVFTDADCLPEKNWLKSINQCFSEEVDFVAGYSPLVFKKKSLLNGLKNLERSSIFAVTAGSFGLNIPLTCTARNMAYRKRIWDKVDGYSGIHNILSGDDDLMLLKSRHTVNKYCFCFDQDAIVDSVEDKDNIQQINQETRRASKFKYYPLYIKLLTLSIAIYYMYLCIAFCQVLLSAYSLKHFIVNICVKLFIEALLIGGFLWKVKRFVLMKYFFLTEILYIPYFLYFGIKGSLFKYKWKN